MEKAYRQFINYSLGVNKKAPNDGSWVNLEGAWGLPSSF